MAASLSVNCPGCQKVLKGKPALIGKTIRCPSCEEMFVFQPAVTAEDAARPGSAGATASEKVTAAAPSIALAGQEEENKYGITELDLTPRCPNCANPLESEDSVVCLFCGYNTMTRTWGKTQRSIASTAGDWIKHLLPGFACLAFIIFDMLAILYLCLVAPYLEWFAESWMGFLNSESMRLWITIINLSLIWAAGLFCYKRLILHPVPPPKLKG